MQSTTRGCETMRRGATTGIICDGANPMSREKDLQRQVQTAKDQLRDMHMSNENTQAKLLDASQRQGEWAVSFTLDLSDHVQNKMSLRD